MFKKVSILCMLCACCAFNGFARDRHTSGVETLGRILKNLRSGVVQKMPSVNALDDMSDVYMHAFNTKINKGAFESSSEYTKRLNAKSYYLSFAVMLIGDRKYDADKREMHMEFQTFGYDEMNKKKYAIPLHVRPAFWDKDIVIPMHPSVAKNLYDNMGFAGILRLTYRLPWDGVSPQNLKSANRKYDGAREIEAEIGERWIYKLDSREIIAISDKDGHVIYKGKDLMRSDDLLKIENNEKQKIIHEQRLEAKRLTQKPYLLKKYYLDNKPVDPELCDKVPEMLTPKSNLICDTAYLPVVINYGVNPKIWNYQVRVLIDENGMPQEIKIIRRDPEYSNLDNFVSKWDEKVNEYIKNQKYIPASLLGASVKSFLIMNIPVTIPPQL